MKKIFNFIYLSSLPVALATGVLSIAFFKLPNGSGQIHWVALSQIILSCWLIYIVDRLLDVIHSETPPATQRHQYHIDHQYMLQVVAIALLAINCFLLFFEDFKVIYWGLCVALAVVIYLKTIVPRWPNSKDYTMPIIYCAAVIGVPFTLASSINMSSWICALMGFFMVLQNLLSFAYFENTQEVYKRKTVLILGSINLFLYLFFFGNAFEYVHQLAGIITLISIVYTLMVSNEDRFKNHYRWIMDGLLFLPVLLF